MNKEERKVRNYLISSGHSNPIYEPDGNIPPDFALNSSIAVEVRRLNQNLLEKDKIRGLEQDQIRLNKAVEVVLKEFDTDESSKSYWISLEYKRPIGNLKRISKLTRQAIQSFLDDNPVTPHQISLTKTVSIRIIQAGRFDTERFRVGLESDEDAGGWVIPLYVENIRYCIQEKEAKVRPYFDRYPEWWLILVDALFGAEARDSAAVIQGVGKSQVFNRIIVLEYESGKTLFEI